GGHVLVVDVLLLALVAQAEQLVGDVERGQGQDPDRVLPGRVAPDLAGPPVHEGGELADVVGAGLAADRVLLPQDLDVDPLLLCHDVPFADCPVAYWISSRSSSFRMPSTWDSTSFRSWRRL